jgi:collagen type II alpha
MTRGFGRFLRQNVIALLALFLALGGTSFAAATLINGKQIKPHTIAKNRLTNTAIKQLKGNRGPAGQRGPTGAQGVQGIQGPPGPYPDQMPAGKTARGTWAMYGTDAGILMTQISFGFRLSAAPTSHIIPVGGPSPPECPGTVTNPQAAAGHLCVYEGDVANVSSVVTCDTTLGGCGPPGTTNAEGAGVVGYPAAAGAAYMIGTWAATAPTSAPTHQAPPATGSTVLRR